MLYLALAIGTMSVVAPIVALSALVPVAVSFVTGTIPSGIVLPGIALALGGAMLVAVTPDDGTARPEHRSRSLWIAVLSALGFGLALVALDAAAASDPLWTVTIARSCAVAVVMATLAIRPPALELGRPGLWRIVAAGVLDAAAITLFAVASNHGGLAVVSVLASLYPVVTVLLARVILEERLRALQAAGVVLALLGAAVVAAGT
jgi:drug/metabolite transporter (DMT)-like permease